MAERVELDQLVYTMSADISRLSKDTKAALDMIKRNANDNQAAFEAAGKKAGHALGKGLTSETGKAVALNRMQMMEFGHVARSVFDSLAAGASPMRVLAMEGPRVAQALGSGEGGLAGGLSAIGAWINPVTLGLAGIAVVLGGLTVAEMSYESEHKKLLMTLMTTAAASGLTVSSMQEIAKAAEKANQASVAMNLSAETTFASVGKVTAENMPASLALLRDYAALMGEKIPQATDELAKHFANPAQGARALTDKLHFLNAEQLVTIERLQAEGKESEALKLMLDHLGPAVSTASEHLSGLGRALQVIANGFKDSFHWLGQFTYGLTHIDDQKLLSMYQKERDQLAQRMKNPTFVATTPGAAASLADDDKRIAELKAAIAAKAAAPGVAAANQASIERLDRRNQADPAQAALRQDTALRTALFSDLKAATSEAEKGQIRQAIVALNQKIKSETAKASGIKVGNPDAEANHLRGLSSSVAQSVDSADRAKAAALAAISDDILSKAKAEKDAVDSALKQTLDGLKAKKEQVDGDKKLSASKKQELDAQLDAAMATQTQAADIKKRTIDAEAQIKLDAEALTRHKEIIGYQIQELKAREAMTSDAAERARIEHHILDLQKSLSDESIRNDQTAKQLRANAASPDGTPVVVASSGLAQKASDAAYASESRQIDLDASPLQRWIAGIGDLGTAMQNAEVDGLQRLTSGLADVIVKGGNAGKVLHDVIQQMEVDLAQFAIKKGISSIFSFLGLPSFDGGGYTGAGPRAGGIDGKGGFLSIMHPHESVTDHTKTVRSASAMPAMRSGGAMQLQLHSTYEIVGTGVNPETRAAIAESHMQAVSTAVSSAKQQMAGWASIQQYERG